MLEMGADLMPELGRSLGEESGNPLQHSCLENPMDGGIWQSAVPEVTSVGHDLLHKPSLPCLPYTVI